MARTLRRTGGRSELDALIETVNALIAQNQMAPHGDVAVVNGSTAGFLRTTNAVDYTAGGVWANKAATDDFWDLTGEATMAALEYRAYRLLVSTGGSATIEAGATVSAASLPLGLVAAGAALPALPSIADGLSIFGIFIAGPSTDFSLALAAQGTLIDGPAGPGSTAALDVLASVAP